MNNQLVDAQRNLMSNNRKLEQALKKNRETNEKLEAAKQSAERAMRQSRQTSQKRIFLRIWAMIFERLWMQLWELIIPIVYYEGAKKWTADFYLKI